MDSGPLGLCRKMMVSVSVSAVTRRELDFSSVIKSAKPPRSSKLTKELGRPSRLDVSPVERPIPFAISVFAGVETNMLFARLDWFFGSNEDQEPSPPQFFSVLREK
ncbi:hypothetical protein CsSME_00022668 [Camellia sinensis var. sinensis]